MIAQCDCQKCKKSNSCRRFLDEIGISHYDFKKICNEDNNFEYYWKVKTEIVNVEENKSESNN